MLWSFTKESIILHHFGTFLNYSIELQKYKVIISRSFFWVARELVSRILLHKASPYHPIPCSLSFVLYFLNILRYPFRRITTKIKSATAIIQQYTLANFEGHCIKRSRVIVSTNQQKDIMVKLYKHVQRISKPKY